MVKNLDRFIGNAVVLFVIIAYFHLFKFTTIPYAIRVLSQFVAIGMLVSLILLRVVYQSETIVKMNFAAPIGILIIGALPSFIVAQSVHNQSFTASLIGNHVLGFYLLYFFAHIYKVSVKYIIRIIVLIGLIVVVLYYLQLLLYPKLILDIVIFESRGTLRLFVPGMLCTQLAYFYFLNRFLEKSKFPDLVLALITASIFILQGSRQQIFAVIFLTLIMLLFSKRVQGRALKIVILSLASVAVFFVFRDIFLELTKVSTSQANKFGEGVRIKAARFFLTSFQSDGWSYFFGNSRAAAGTIYQQRMSFYSLRYGYYISDIGVIGDYVRYGIIFVVAGLTLIAKSIGLKISYEYRYLKYYIIMQCFTLLTGKGIFAGVDIILILILYAFDLDRAQQKQDIENKEIVE